MCAKLHFNVYGTRAAASAWERDYGEKMTKWGFIRGASSPCIFRHGSRPIWIVVHGDDFIILAPEEEIGWFRARMNEEYESKLVGMIGPEEHDAKSMKLLNRIVEWRDDGICLESDQRHTDIVVKELGLQDAKRRIYPRREGEGL